MKELHPRRERSRSKVLISLRNEPKRFKDLQSETQLSPRGLDLILKFLMREKEIERTDHEGKPAFQLTKNGTESVKTLINLAGDVNAILSRDGVHQRYEIGVIGMLQAKLPLGITTDLTFDRDVKRQSLLSDKDIESIKNSLIKKIQKNIKDKNLNKKSTGKLVLGFVLDFPTFEETLKMTTREYRNNLSALFQHLQNKFGQNVDDIISEDRKKEIAKKIQKQSKAGDSK